MQTHLLKRNSGNTRPRPRVGRGGKRGTTSGKGTKGQRSRTGHRIRPAERDFIQRLPKLRGFKNVSRVLSIPVNLDRIEASFAGTQVTAEALREAGIAKGKGKIKILGTGTLTKKLSFVGVAVSATARKKIEAAGGTVRA